MMMNKKKNHVRSAGFTPTPTLVLFRFFKTLSNVVVATAQELISTKKHSETKKLHQRWCRGFTLVELLIVLGVFSVMTGVVLAGYGTYNSNALFANASEDVVLALRQAQVYGAGARGEVTACGGATAFDCSYGVFFSLTAPDSHGIKVFADVNSDRVYTAGVDTLVPGASVAWSDSISVAGLSCGGASCILNKASVTFRRPNPDAFIADIPVADPLLPSPYNSIAITLADTKSGKTSTVNITRTGQISLQ